jgi:hypothetical protein
MIVNIRRDALLLRDAQIEPAGHREGRNHNDFSVSTRLELRMVKAMAQESSYETRLV